MTSIHFILKHHEQEIFIETHAYEFENLMELIQNKIFIEEFGECLGMGRCCTCLIQFSDVSRLPIKERNETATLNKNNIDSEVQRLACQIEIGAFLNGLVVTIV